MIKSLKVTNLNRCLSFDLNFHDDINIITGKNGSGKTTVLKLLWYAISGNIERILQEVIFDSFDITTDKLAISVMKEEVKKGRLIWRIAYTPTGGERKEIINPIERTSRWEELTELNRHSARLTNSSVFFPTFRRIEGGFSLSNNDEPFRYMNVHGAIEWVGSRQGSSRLLKNSTCKRLLGR